MSTNQPKQPPKQRLEQTPKQTPTPKSSTSTHDDMLKLKDRPAKMEGTSTREKGIFRKLDEFEQHIARKKIMRTILATYPPTLDEQDSTKFSNK